MHGRTPVDAVEVGLLEHGHQVGRRVLDQEGHRDRQLAIRGLLPARRGYQLAGQDLLPLAVAERELGEQRLGTWIRLRQRRHGEQNERSEPNGGDDSWDGSRHRHHLLGASHQSGMGGQCHTTDRPAAVRSLPAAPRLLWAAAVSAEAISRERAAKASL